MLTYKVSLVPDFSFFLLVIVIPCKAEKNLAEKFGGSVLFL